ncbi:MAG: TatD family hydrolase [Chloroflexota bacterium]
MTDTHCHLTLPEFEADRQATLERAREAGVTSIVVPGIDLETSRRSVAFAEAHPGVFAAVGVHPHHAAEWNGAAKAELRALARSPRVVAIGETGLDYYRELSPRSAQRRALEDQLDLAEELGLPVILHNRQAIEELLGVLEAWAPPVGDGAAQRSGVLHAYSADLPSARRALAAGFYLGVAGPVTYRSTAALRAALRQVPLGRIVLETDAPYLPPHPYRGKRNEPAYATRVAEEVAQLLDLTYPSLAETTTHNAAALFGWHHDLDHCHLL